MSGNQTYEIYEEKTWEIFDPWRAKTIAIFQDEALAQKVLQWLQAEHPPTRRLNFKETATP